METYSNYLEHHGILGQKWGKKNGPPYPLSSEQMTSRELRKNQKRNYIELKKAYKKQKNNPATRGYNQEKTFSSVPFRAVKDRYIQLENDRYRNTTDKLKKVKPGGTAWWKYEKFRSDDWGRRNIAVENVVSNFLGKYGHKKIKEIAKEDTHYGSQAKYKEIMTAEDLLKSQVFHLLWKADDEY